MFWVAELKDPFQFSTNMATAANIFFKVKKIKTAYDMTSNMFCNNSNMNIVAFSRGTQFLYFK